MISYQWAFFKSQLKSKNNFNKYTLSVVLLRLIIILINLFLFIQYDSTALKVSKPRILLQILCKHSKKKCDCQREFANYQLIFFMGFPHKSVPTSNFINFNFISFPLSTCFYKQKKMMTKLSFNWPTF